MKPVTDDMLQSLIQKLQASSRLLTPQSSLFKELGLLGEPINTTLDPMTLALMGRLQSPVESSAEIEKLNSA